MYAIYTNLYGVHIPDELNRLIQNSDLSECFDGLELPDGFECDVPYSGDRYADIHLGIELSSTDDHNNNPPRTVPTDAEKALWAEGLIALKQQLPKEIQEWKEEFPDDEYEDIDKALAGMMTELEKEPATYQAYSTS